MQSVPARGVDWPQSDKDNAASGRRGAAARWRDGEWTEEPQLRGAAGLTLHEIRLCAWPSFRRVG